MDLSTGCWKAFAFKKTSLMLVMLAAFQFIEKQRHETSEWVIKTRYDEEAIEKFIYWHFFVYFSYELMCLLIHNLQALSELFASVVN